LLLRDSSWGFDISGASKRHAGRMTASSLIMSSTTSSKETVAIIGGGKYDLRISDWHVLSNSKKTDRGERLTLVAPLIFPERYRWLVLRQRAVLVWKI
jgi:hypothetical protein